MAMLNRSIDDLSVTALGRRVQHMRNDPTVPLCVKLEGVILWNGTTAELALALLRHRPLMFFAMLGWLFLGRTKFRERVVQSVEIDPATLPYRRATLNLLWREAATGRDIILVTCGEPRVARAIANHLGVFTDIIEVERGETPPGDATALELCGRFGSGDFDYAGNGRGDIPVWRTARRSVLVAPSPRLLTNEIWNSQAADIISPRDRRSMKFVDALRPGRWVKNLLVFLPLLGAAGHADPQFLVKLYLAFSAYCLLSSAGYVANDLIDLAADRKHSHKRRRGLASGRLSITRGIFLFAGLAAAGLGLALFLSPLLAGWMGVFLALSLAYSLWIKKVLLIDTFALVALYLHRVLTGFIVAGQIPTFWQILFAGFFFLGLAMLTRYGELVGSRRSGTRLATRARAYRTSDLDILASFGLASGYLSVIILAFYAQTAEAHALFRSPELLWILCPLLIYWIARVWVFARRGRIPSDPVLFALKDPVSGGIALACAGIVLVAFLAKLPINTLV